MKRLLLITVLFIGGLIAPKTAEAQIQVRVNIGVQPIWGPVGFEYVEYYYIPEIDVYYHVPTREFIYYKNGRWIARRTLPAMYRHFDFYRTRVVVVNEYRPFLRHHEIKRRYSNYRDFRPYITIRDVRDSRYYVNRNHPEHYRWMKAQQRRDRDDRYRDDRNRRDSDRHYNDRRDNDRRDNDRKKVVKKNSKDNNKKDNRNDNRDNNRNDNRDNNRSGGSIYRR